MKIPVCRLVCFRCILPKCYNGEDSDDEDVNVKDEGYHSQNRRSSEITPNQEGGAQGGVEPQTVEMAEFKSETVTLIPPPRTTVNEYGSDPCKSETSSNKNNGEVTYIEVESVSLTGSDAALNIPDSDSKSDDTKEFKLETLETGYEEPVHAGVLEFPILKTSDQGSEYVDCDHSDDSESRIYVNESVLGIVTESDGKKSAGTDKNYVNVDPSEGDKGELHSKSSLGKPHEYVNLPPAKTAESTASGNLDSLKNSIETNETKSEDFIKEANKEKQEMNITNTEEKLHTVDTADQDTIKSNHLETEEKRHSSDKDFVINNSDAERLLKKNKQKDVDTEKDAQEDLEENSENDLAGDRTKLL